MRPRSPFDVTQPQIFSAAFRPLRIKYRFLRQNKCDPVRTLPRLARLTFLHAPYERR